MNKELNFTARDWIACVGFGLAVTGAVVGAVCSIYALAVLLNAVSF